MSASNVVRLDAYRANVSTARMPCATFDKVVRRVASMRVVQRTPLATVRTARDFEQALERSGRMHWWESVQVRKRTRYRLAGYGDPCTAYVQHEHGRLIVTLCSEYEYWFDLRRLHEDYMRLSRFPTDSRRGYTWQQHIRGKTWCTDEQLHLLDELCAVLAPHDGDRA
jgi:hypothetical protein